MRMESKMLNAIFVVVKQNRCIMSFKVCQFHGKVGHVPMFIVHVQNAVKDNVVYLYFWHEFLSCEHTVSTSVLADNP